MDCKEYERLIPLFIEGKMHFKLLKKFCEHIDSCPNCKEELDIQVLVREGVQRLEEGDAFDLQFELKQRLEEARRKIRFHNRFIRIGEVLEVLFVIWVTMIVIWIML